MSIQKEFEKKNEKNLDRLFKIMYKYRIIYYINKVLTK